MGLGLCTLDPSEDEIPPSLPPFGSLFIYTLLFGKAPLPPGTLVASRRSCTACWTSAGVGVLFDACAYTGRWPRAKVSMEIPSCNKDSTACVWRCQVQQMHWLALRRPSNDAKCNRTSVIRS